jgi:NADH-quinone oxidoreductase subunit C
MSSEAKGKGIAYVRESHADAVLLEEVHEGQEAVTVQAEAVHEVVAGLKEAGFGFLDDLTAVDYLDRKDVEGRVRVVYEMLNMEERELFRVKAHVEDEDVEVPTVSDLFATADWLEREVYDMFGIRFAGHPDLRRILMPEDWEGFPCRRDYPMEGNLPIYDPMRERDFARDMAGEQSE